MAELTIVGLGPGDPDLLTLEARRALIEADTLILRTERHGVADGLRAEGIRFTTLDPLYEGANDFEEIEEACAKAVRKALKTGDVTYGVPGQGILSDGSVQQLLRSRIRVRILPGISPADLALTAAGRESAHAADGLTQIPASLISSAALNPRLPLIVTELDDPYQAGEAKLILQSVYGDDASGIYISPERARRLPLALLDRQKDIDHRCVYYLPGRDEKARMDFTDLLGIMETLRVRCPWDRKQSHESLRRYLLEEAYEAVDAIDRDDPQSLAEELGDVLYQVVFHAVIASGMGDFDILDITDSICRKMISRHPAVFSGKGDPDSDNENWEANKARAHGDGSALESASRIAKALPALMRAQKLAKYLPGEKLDIPEMDDRAAGDWLLAAAYALREQGIDAESALREACERQVGR